MNEKRRKIIWLKYNKHCAYCGNIIRYEDLEVDHIDPCSKGGRNSKANFNPSCFRCNNYKSNHSLEQLRVMLKHLHSSIKDNPLAKVAICYGIVKLKPWDGKFYFEKLEEQNP